MRFVKLVSFTGVVLLMIVLNSVNTGCSKPVQQNPADTTTITPPPPPPPPPTPTTDTVGSIKKLEVLTSLYPGYGIQKYRTFSFTYDAQKRLTEVGIKNYGILQYDSFTTKLSYTGSSNLPNRIIMPDINGLKNSSYPPNYDTTWFYYNASGKLIKDSTNEVYYYATSRNPMYRTYAYPGTNKGTVDWFYPASGSPVPQLLRRDTVTVNANGNEESIKVVYFYYLATGQTPGTFMVAGNFTFSNVINPLSRLNISGTHFSLIYTRVKSEVLGNTTYQPVYNSNGSPDYLDFISPFIPTSFSMGTGFLIEITPMAQHPTYPSEIKVSMGTSLFGDKYIYRYTY